MSDTFIEDLRQQLAEQLVEDLMVEHPQQDDEFTVAWFAANVMHCRPQAAKAKLDALVRSGKVAVRNGVKITWTVGTPSGCKGNVYRYIGGKELRRKLKKPR